MAAGFKANGSVEGQKIPYLPYLLWSSIKSVLQITVLQHPVSYRDQPWSVWEESTQHGNTRRRGALRPSRGLAPIPRCAWSHCPGPEEVMGEPVSPLFSVASLLTIDSPTSEGLSLVHLPSCLPVLFLSLWKVWSPTLKFPRIRTWQS